MIPIDKCGFIEGLKTEFHGFTVRYGMSAAFW